MASATIWSNSVELETIAIETDVLKLLQQQGAQTLDQLEIELNHIGSAQLLFAIDRLSRSGIIVIGRPKNGDYLVWIPPQSPAQGKRVPPAPRGGEL